MLRIALKSLLAVTLISGAAAQEPVGTVAAWHADLSGTPALPAGWARLDGGVHVEPTSPYHGLALPDLNGVGGTSSARFLRGAVTSGGFEADAIQGHAHGVSSNATDGSTYGICPAFMEAGFGLLILYGPAGISVADPIDDGTHGPPRTATETRPANMSVVWILKTSAGELPVGTLVAWHRNHPALLSPELPAGWALCNGGVLDDPSSPYHGITLPDLNESGRFLRGGPTSGVFQGDAFQGHTHSVSHGVKRLTSQGFEYYDAIFGSAKPTRAATISVRDPVDDGANGLPRVDDETRPTNMSVVWVLKSRDGAQLPEGVLFARHDDPAAALPPLETGRSAWYPCDGRQVRTPGSPYEGAILPELNLSGRFLRGGLTSGVFQADAFQGHWHDVLHNAFSYQYLLEPGAALWGSCGDDFANGPLSIGGVTGARSDDETRPVNMGAPWIMYLPRDRGPWKARAPAPAGP